MRWMAAPKKWGDALFGCLLVAVVLALYVPAVHFGLIWDDPRYYQGLLDQSSLGQILTSPQPPTYQFYRPVAVLYGRLFVSPDGIVNAPLAHAFQIGMHLISALVTVPILRAFGFGLGHARLAALCFAIFPLSYQAVAWQQNQQPLMFMGVLLAILAAHQFCQRRSIVFLGLSLLAYAFALLAQEGALPFVFVFLWLATRDRQVSPQPLRWPPLLSRGWPLLHLGLALLYASVWLVMPRQASVTGQGFQLIVLGYLLQGLVFPVSGLISGLTSDWPLFGLISLFVTVGLILVWGVCKWASARSAVWSCAWILAGLLPIWAALSWVYVEPSPRLLYPASLGIAALWAGWTAWAFSAHHAWWRRGLGLLVLVAVLVTSFQQWWQFQKLYQTGTQHLARAVELFKTSPQARLLFVNFPDRIEIRPRMYPLGFWGVILSPVVQNLSDYAHAQSGVGGEDRSLAAFLVGADERGNWPYRVDMRGEDTPPEALFRSARWADGIYLTRYRPDGALEMLLAGDVRPIPSLSPTTHAPIATLGDSAQLIEALAEISPSQVLTLRLTWHCLKPLDVHDTIFVHFWKDGVFRGSADGDSLGGLISLLAWEPGSEILDVRQVALSNFEPGVYQVTVGIYNRIQDTRYSAWAANGERFRDNEVPGPVFSLP